MGFVVLGGMAVSALFAVVGLLMVLAAAFAEGLVWGLVCIFVPGGLVYFAITHWDEAKKGFFFWAGGLVGIFAIAAAGMPAVREESEAAKAAASAEAETKSKAKSTQCPAALPPSEGFALYCCTPNGWFMQAQTGCAATYAPGSACDASRLGATQLEGCSTLGAKKKPKDGF